MEEEIQNNLDVCNVCQVAVDNVSWPVKEVNEAEVRTFCSAQCHRAYLEDPQKYKNNVENKSE